MTEKEMQSKYPVNGHANGDTEAAAAAHDATELRRKKKRKCIIFIIVFIVSNVVINSIMAVTILKARNPAFRIRNAAFNAGPPARLSLEFSLKNTNFGQYKYPGATVEFTSEGAVVGTANVPNSKVGWRSTKKFKLDVELNLGTGLNDTVIPVRAMGKLRGKAAIMFMMKKRKGADLDCTVYIVRATQQIGNISCK